MVVCLKDIKNHVTRNDTNCYCEDLIWRKIYVTFLLWVKVMEVQLIILSIFFFLIKKIDFIDSELNLHSSVLLIQGGDSSTILHFVLPEI